LLEPGERFGRQVEVGGELLFGNPARKLGVLSLEAQQPAGRIEKVERDRMRHDFGHKLHDLVLETRLDRRVAVEKLDPERHRNLGSANLGHAHDGIGDGSLQPPGRV